MKKYIIAIDQGTTSSRAIIFDTKGQLISSASNEIKLYFEQENYVEQDAYELLDSVNDSIKTAILKANIDTNDIIAVGITNQRETTILWDRKTGTPVHKAVVWQSKQSKEICDNLKLNKYDALFKDKTGLVIDPYFSATKIRWILDHVKGTEKLMQEKSLSFGTVDSWLLYNLTDKKVHATDATNASRTMLFNIKDEVWDEELLDILAIDKGILPKVLPSNSIFGETDLFGVLDKKIPISGILGDQHAALFGQACFEKGMIKNTYGTGCFMLLNTGEVCTPSEKGLLTTIAYKIDNKTTYALEGSVFVAGSAIQWLRDALSFFTESKESETLATSVDDNFGVVVVPSFVGLGTPYWDSEVRGAMFGLTRGTNKAHITRATLESLAYQTRDIVDVMFDEANIQPHSIKVDGGASNNNFLMQFQSDILNINIKRPKISESTALGAMLIASLGAKVYKNLTELENLVIADMTFTPKMSEVKRNKLYSRWQKAIKATRTFI